jgi:hypothetical protein
MQFYLQLVPCPRHKLKGSKRPWQKAREVDEKFFLEFISAKERKGNLKESKEHKVYERCAMCEMEVTHA